MIAYLSGSIINQTDSYIIVLTNQSVGYKISVTKNFLSNKKQGEPISLYIHTYVKEDALNLYGFSEEHELLFFEQLIAISGIGPKIALEILESPTLMLKQAIINNDIKLLTRIKGLGKKTAERLVLELKNKIDLKDIQPTDSQSSPQSAQIENDIIDALMGLGYDKYAIVKTLTNLPEEKKEDSEEVIKWFLRQC